MSEKIVITVEQDELIKEFLNHTEKSVVLKQHVTGWTDADNLSLNTLTFDQMARILYEPNSYEVEPNIKIGEWVKIIKQFKPLLNDGRNEAAYKLERIFKVTNLVLGGKIVCPDRYIHNPENLVQATKKEIIFAELGRGLNEFVDGDRIIFKDDTSTIIDSVYPATTDFVKGKCEKGRVKGFYPANSFIKLP